MINSRVVLHFPGFEPLDAEAHRQRYQRSAAQAAQVWDCRFDVGPLLDSPADANFSVHAAAAGWTTQSEIHVFDHNDLITDLRRDSVWRQIAAGYAAGFSVIKQGAAAAYFRHAWRFALFFLFPYLFLALGAVIGLEIAVLPVTLDLNPFWLLLSLPIGYAFFRYGWMRFSDRYHVLHLLADWRLAVAIAENRSEVAAWIERQTDRAERALATSADEILVTSHSMGASLALSVVGRLIERNPTLPAGRRITFVTLGGAALQCSLLSGATVLRSRIGLVARHAEIDWFDIQCLTDPIHLYKCHTVALSGHPDAPQPKLAFVRFKHAMSAERYAKNRRDFLRMHRQYVLGPDQKSGYDFTLMTAGPLPALAFANLKATQPPVF
ncbi:hypothetical protein ASE36_09200 [Rhizobium sp. Root274]|uniref:hypothetical protein n=1 Tax=unclassified Rhizobium TaxID=2613769 RepID=UPI0007137ECA|nr:MULTISPECIES: hypothetical protein [unclassified Rhizobium]KQW28667.1 hypothetical protein ASC71_09215 [Rhizobium sp. Root1240]KRD28867.1 hypothetical protein ASE36_09200 [Rhizobium sp. Root274]